MSQKTLKGFPVFSGSIQYSPSPLEFPESRISLQEFAGCERKPVIPIEENRTRIEIKANRSVIN